MAGNATQSGRSTIDRVAALLGSFTSRKSELSLSEIAAKSGIPSSTAHRLLSELVRTGLVQKRTDRYSPGPALWRAGVVATSYQQIREAAYPALSYLSELTQQNVQLAVRYQQSVLYLEKLTGPRSVPSLTEVAGTMPMHATAVGKAILAFEDPEVAADVLKSSLPSFTERTITDPDVLTSVFAQTRSTGLAYSYGEMTPGASSVAAPIFGAEGVVASIGVVVPLTSGLAQFGTAVKSVAASTSVRLVNRRDNRFC